MSQAEPEEAPEEVDHGPQYDLAGNLLPPVRYDLAGNPLPPLPSAARPAAPAYSAGAPTAPPPASGPARAPAFTPPPGAGVTPGGIPPPGGAAAWGGPVFSAGAKPQSSAPAWGLYAGLGIGAIVLIGLIFALRAAKPVMVRAPVSYKTYTALDNTFSCDQPAGWEMKETGAEGGTISTVVFRQSKAAFHVVSDAAGSLMSETTASANANLPPAQQTPPVQKLHDMDKQQLSGNFSDYRETDPATFTSHLGDSRASEWTANRSAGSGALHGYRVTMLGKDREITVICDCPERNWAILKPAFQRMINSIVPGSG